MKKADIVIGETYQTKHGEVIALESNRAKVHVRVIATGYVDLISARTLHEMPAVELVEEDLEPVAVPVLPVARPRRLTVPQWCYQRSLDKWGHEPVRWTLGDCVAGVIGLAAVVSMHLAVIWG